MKRIATALGICALLLGPVAAEAADYDWTGASSTAWRLSANWTGAVGYPGQFNNSPTATIDDGSSNATVVVSGTVTWDVDWVLVDAETANCDLTLKIDTNADLDVIDGSNTGYIWLIAGTHGDPVVADDAELWHAGGNLEVDIIDADGGVGVSTHGDRGKAVLDFDVSSGSGTGLEINVGIECSGDVLIEVASGVAVNLGDLTIESTANVKITGQGASAEMEVSDWSNTSNRPIEFHASGADFVIEHE